MSAPAFRPANSFGCIDLHGLLRPGSALILSSVTLIGVGVLQHGCSLRLMTNSALDLQLPELGVGRNLVAAGLRLDVHRVAVGIELHLLHRGLRVHLRNLHILLG